LRNTSASRTLFSPKIIILRNIRKGNEEGRMKSEEFATAASSEE
jgi:hypothetical protein